MRPVTGPYDFGKSVPIGSWSSGAGSTRLPAGGKSRAAAAIARLYRDLGVLSYGNLIELHPADLAGATALDTARRSRSPATW